MGRKMLLCGATGFIGRNLLEYFYEDTKKYGFAFQMNAFISRTKDIIDMDREIEY